MLLEDPVTLALLIGMLSALSLPLGALTILVWQPSQKRIAWLMAFGAGALLAAVTIDLMAPSINQGYFVAAALGAIIGSLFYLALNKTLNEKGGFLRKSATMIQYLKTRQRAHHHQWGASINRLPLFDDLSDSDSETLFSYFKLETFQANEIIYHQGDRSNHFYIIKSGKINLRRADLGLKLVEKLQANDAFGHLSFLTSTHNAYLAQAEEEVKVWVINRQNFNRFIHESDEFFTLLQTYLADNSALLAYLTKHHKVTETQAVKQLDFIAETLVNDRRLPFDREERDTYELAFERLKTSTRFDFITQMNPSTLAILASKLKLRQARKGDTLFTHHSDADRLYLMESGQVELVGPARRKREEELLSQGMFFGGLAYLVGGRHISTAMAQTEVTFWILDRKDLDQLLQNTSILHGKFKSYLKSDGIFDYLVESQKMSAYEAKKWIKASTASIVPESLPHLPDLENHTFQHQAAYMAIWLGLFLDGIPESLMIGSHLTEGHMISISLVAAIFISNYPEALSSAASMREQGIPYKRILLAWVSLMLLTGLGAAIGSATLAGISPEMFFFISGIAAGAMLTVISETMLPEAYAKGGSITGFLTLIGFLTAISFKLFD